MTSSIVESISVEGRASLFAALSDPIRLRVLDQLTNQKQCVCKLQETIAIAPNLLSYHLRVLREAGLVEATKRGRWVDYQLSPGAADAIRAALPKDIASLGRP